MNFCRKIIHMVDTSKRVSERPVTGAQVVGRLAEVLRFVSQTMPHGASTSEVAHGTGLARTTVHRLLSSLAQEGFIDRDQHTGHWFLGPEIYLMGNVASERYDISDTARRHVSVLAEATGESAFLSMRRGNETVCMLRADGSFPIRSFVLFEGKRFPLGVASAGLAILSYLTPDQIDRYFASTSLETQYGDSHTEAEIRGRIAETRRTGYSVNPALIVEGSWGMGAAVFGPSGQPSWALSLTGIEPRFSAERRPELGRLLLDHAHQLSQHFSER